MAWLVIGLILFHGIHSLRMFAPQWRDAKYQAMGEGPWKGVFSLVSVVALVLMIFGYWVARENALLLYVPPQWGRHVTLLLMIPAFILMTFNLRSSRFRAITHHPFLTAICLWSAAHLFANGDAASVLLFGSFLFWALVNWQFVSQRGDPLPPVQSLAKDLGAIAFALVLYGLFIWKLHEWLFGVAPIPSLG